MCGIAGFSHTTDLTRRMTPFLLWDIESRGGDSWGATDGNEQVKCLGPVTRTFHSEAATIAGWERAIFHTRASSTGAVSIPNQHPFTFVEGGDEGTPGWVRTITGIHNGIISNHNDLNRRYPTRGFDVDSMHIFKHLAERLPMGELCGYGNLAWYEKNRDFPLGRLHLLRFNGDALHIAKMETGEIVFCSTESAIRRAANVVGGRVKHFMKTSPEYIYTIEPAEGGKYEVFQSRKKLPFGNRTSYESYGGGATGNGFSRGGDGRFLANGDRNNTHFPGYARNGSNFHRTDVLSGVCHVQGCSNKVEGTRKTHLVCKKHFDAAVRDAATRVPTIELTGVGV